MDTQSDVPSRENILFTECLKAVLVLLSNTQLSRTGKMGESLADTNKKMSTDSKLKQMRTLRFRPQRHYS